jgi:hypothetical protein
MEYRYAYSAVEDREKTPAKKEDREKRSPFPMIVLNVQQEINTNNSDRL